MELFFVNFCGKSNDNEVPQRALDINEKKQVVLKRKNGKIFSRGILMRDRYIICFSAGLHSSEEVIACMEGNITSLSYAVLHDKTSGLTILEAEMAPRIYTMRHASVGVGDIVITKYGKNPIFGSVDNQQILNFIQQDEGNMKLWANKNSGSIVVTPEGEIAGILCAQHNEYRGLWACATINSANQLLHDYCED